MPARGAIARKTWCPEPLAPWLYRVVRNRAISAGRSERRRAEREKRVATREAWFDGGASRIDAEEAAAALATLALELREVVVARIWGSLKFSEIAELVGISLSTAQRRYEQGLIELQARLEKPTTDPAQSEKPRLEQSCPNIDPNTK